MNYFQHKVFVYGSLKQGFGNSHLLIGSNKIGMGITNDDIYAMRSLGSFPAVFRNAGNEAICGEIWEVNDIVLTKLDALEGHPRLYNRLKTKIIDSNDNEHIAWMYAMDDEKMMLYASKFDASRIEIVEFDGVKVANWLPTKYFGSKI
jgi:gamma-glutamylcyclotransferase (GGCT)/AIG2-like uncharacterized protein YtfP